VPGRKVWRHAYDPFVKNAAAYLIIRRSPRYSLRRSWPRNAWVNGMAWSYLIIAGLLEIGWAIGLKYTDGFTRLWPTLWTAASMLASISLLGLALKTLPVGTGYAVWTGIGAVGTAILGIYLFGEPATVPRLLSIGLISSGIIGLKLIT
jgi:quaternary ammonium compound-resistance protein SugE